MAMESPLLALAFLPIANASLPLAWLDVPSATASPAVAFAL
ncbi:hypothetical protein O3617_07595 [Veillonella sp. 27098_8_77]